MSALSATLARLVSASSSTGCAFVAAGGKDAFTGDATATHLLDYVLGTLPQEARDAVQEELILVVTPSAILIHCTALPWLESLLPALEDTAREADNLIVDAYVPELPAETADAASDFKLEAFRAMLKRAASEASAIVAGSTPLPLAGPKDASWWPLLFAATLGAPVEGPVSQTVDPAAAAATLELAMRSVEAAALGPGGWVHSAVHAITAGWQGLLARVAKVSDAYDRGEMSEAGLSEAMVKAMVKATASATASVTAGVAPAAADATFGVWAGTGTALCGRKPPRRRQLRMSGACSCPSLHLIARLVAPHSDGLSAARTLFLSNGKVPHHWQHRVFSDGEVFDPIVEDEV